MILAVTWYTSLQVLLYKVGNVSISTVFSEDWLPVQVNMSCLVYLPVKWSDKMHEIVMKKNILTAAKSVDAIIQKLASVSRSQLYPICVFVSIG